MSFRWGEYLDLAKELSQKGGEAATRSAISRAYYAAYRAARRHQGSKSAVPTKSGSHAAVWKALRESDNKSWRKAGNQGKDILEYRGEADYDDVVPELTRKMHRTVRPAAFLAGATAPAASKTQTSALPYTQVQKTQIAAST